MKSASTLIFPFRLVEVLTAVALVAGRGPIIAAEVPSAGSDLTDKPVFVRPFGDTKKVPRWCEELSPEQLSAPQANLTSKSQLSRGWRAMVGAGCDIDLVLAEDMLEKSADAGEVQAAFWLAKLRWEGEGRKNNLERDILPYFEKAAAGNHARSMVFLSSLPPGPRERLGTVDFASESKKSDQWLERAAKLGQPYAISNMISRSFFGAPGNKQFPSNAADHQKWLTRLKEARQEIVAHERIEDYLDMGFTMVPMSGPPGSPVPIPPALQNSQEAMQTFLTACDYGLSEAMVVIARSSPALGLIVPLYSGAQPPPPPPFHAMFPDEVTTKWLTGAVARGNRHAMFLVAKHLLNSDRRGEAMNWYRAAVARGDRAASFDLSQLVQDPTKLPRFQSGGAPFKGIFIKVEEE